MWRILVVDDEPDVRTIIVATLKSSYEVLEAHDGLDALEKLDRYEPDFVLMDVMMPLMNGFEACSAIRKNPRFSALPVMFLTALGGKEDIKKGYGAGANLYLTKPFDPSRLLKNIDVFFQTTPPQQKRKRYSLKELKEAEAANVEPAAPGSGEFQKPEAPEKVEAPVEDVSPVGPKPRVMIVDDDEDIQDLMKASLERDFELVRAGDGMEAIERLVRYQPDILVIDIMLPKMSGFQLCQSLRSNRAFRRLPIMVCTAKSGDKDRQMASRVGANDFLTKPFMPSDLLGKVRDLMKMEGFRVRPKKYTIEEIQDMEAPKEKSDVFDGDLEARHVKESHKAMDRFLQKEGEKEAFERPGEKEHKDADGHDKRKRKFFGFGRKE
ncbi:response regulator [bacterium]|nr:response regulator [bacterium]